MRLLRNIMLLTALTLATGCVREEYGFCPSLNVDNVQIEFVLPDSNGNCVFLDKVSAVDLALFNAEGNLVEVQSINRAMLDQRKGVLLSLEPGTYHILGWANSGTLTGYQGVTAGTACNGANVTYRNATTGGSVGDCDPVYYTASGPHTRSVVDGGQFIMQVTEAGYSGKLDFRAAHRQLQILVKGFNDGTGNTHPTIELTGLRQGVDFFSNSGITDAQGNPLYVSSRKATTDTTDEGIVYAGALFSTFWFDKQNDIMINILHPSTGEIIDSIPLKDVLDEGDDKGEVRITLKLEYKSTGVSVTVEGWSGGKTVIDFD